MTSAAVPPKAELPVGAGRFVVVLLVVAVAPWLAGCGPLDPGSDSPGPALASAAEPDPAAPAATVAPGTGSEIAPETAPEIAPDTASAPPASRVAIEPAPGSSDLDPDLSPDPQIVHPADTCYVRSAATTVGEPIDCAQPHTIEVYASVRLPERADASLPGLDEAIAGCQGDFQARTGVGLRLATVFDRSVLRPSEASWAEGHRTVTCYVVYPQPVVNRLVDIDPLRSFGRVSLFGLAAGDCLAGFDPAANWFELAPCDQPHEAEVFLDLELPAGPYPGDDVVGTTGAELCRGPGFEEFVGRDAASSTVRSLISAPTAETWAEGDRTVACILVDGLVRSRTLRDSGL